METTFGRWLKQQRRVLDLTQQELADQSGCAVVTIRKLESGERKPSKQLAELLGKLLHVADADLAAFVAFARVELGGAQCPTAASQKQSVPWPKPERRRRRANAWHRQPCQSTPILGRRIELQEIGERLSKPQCRLMTLIGPGGIGKTRLALAIAEASADHYQDGAYFVPLAAITTSYHLATAIAEAVGFTFTSNRDAIEQLLLFLQRSQMLLILDNFEHLLRPEARPEHTLALVSTILAEAPQVQLLVTSRERLMLQAEWIYQVQGMDYPRMTPVSSVDLDAWLDKYGALQLFASYAQRVQPNFVINETNLPAILRICHIMDGLPLGIELATSWLYTMTVFELADAIEENLNVLATEYRDVEERHRSLRTVFEYSWQHLSPVEQAVLARLAVFRDGFDREAALEISGASLFYLTTLVNKSLVRLLACGRYAMPELLRQFCLEKLREVDGEELSAERPWPLLRQLEGSQVGSTNWLR